MILVREDREDPGSYKRVNAKQDIGIPADSSYIECNVTILSDASEEKFDATITPNPRFVGIAFRNQVFGIPIENVYVRRRDIDFSKGNQRLFKFTFR